MSVLTKVHSAATAVWYYVDSNPAMSRMGRRTLDRIQADTSPAQAW